MSEAAAQRPAGTSATAGGLLRAAREKQGLHVAALAASIKVTPRKLEALEADRYEELPDLTFARALAKTVCRALKIDAAPVLALLPQLPINAAALTRVSTGLATPFRERPARGDPPDWAVLQRPVLWGAGLVLLAALVVFMLPPDIVSRLTAAGEPDPAAPAPVVAEAPASAVIETVHSAPPQEPATSASAAITAATPAASEPAAAAPLATHMLVLRTSAESWVEVQDSGGQVLVSRTLQVGETVGLDGALPFRLKIGNAAGTQVTFRGQPVELNTRDNVARIELK